MASPVVMPRQGNTVESCTIVEWHKKKGDRVSTGDILFTYETDKATFEFESPLEGELLDIFFGDGEDVPVLTNVGAIGVSGEDYESLRPSQGTDQGDSASAGTVSAQKPREKSLTVEAAEVSRSVAVDTGAGGGPVSPRARRLAEKRGVATAAIGGSGPHGRIIERDIPDTPVLTRTAIAQMAQGGFSPPGAGTGIGGRVRLADLVGVADSVGGGLSAEGFSEVKMSKMRTIIADKMTGSLARGAQLTMSASADARRILACRAKIKAEGKTRGLADSTINDLVAFVLTRILPGFPEVNSLVLENTLRRYERVHLAVAIDTPRGLMVPVVPSADTLSLGTLTEKIKRCARQCLDGSINPDELSGGTITITNLGMYGIEHFTPIINPPQVAIVGVNTIVPRPVALKQGGIEMVPYIGLSLTIDHRALDGAPAARFLKAFVEAIEHFSDTLAL